jgi:hypothetical protein
MFDDLENAPLFFVEEQKRRLPSSRSFFGHEKVHNPTAD